MLQQDKFTYSVTEDYYIPIIFFPKEKNFAYNIYKILIFGIS